MSGSRDKLSRAPDIRWHHRQHPPNIHSHYFLVRRWRGWYRRVNRLSLWITHRLIGGWPRHEFIVLHREFFHTVIEGRAPATHTGDVGVLK